MLLSHSPSRSLCARWVLAVALVCALLATQWRLNAHVVAHEFSTTSLTQHAHHACNHEAPASQKEAAGCLVCLEHQSHGAALISHVQLHVVRSHAILMARALPPNTPYLAPERARQRAPPVFS
jgi:hypothetical protein